MRIVDESVFYDSAENMNYQGMSFLNSRRGTGRHDDADIHEIAELAAVVSGKSNFLQAEGLGGFQSTHDVGRVSTSRNREDRILGLGKGFELAGKNFFEAKVIGDGRQRRRVGG